MIRSIFDTEDEKNESKTENKIDESPKTGNLMERRIVEPPQNPSVESGVIQPALTESAAPKNETSENSPENVSTSDSRSASDFESEKVVKDIEYGDSFLELEKEVAKIEREVRLESEAQSVEPAVGAEKLENTENKPAPEKTEPAAGGIFTSALHKSGQEKPRAGTSLENLLIMPNETPDNTDVSINQNHSFILPDRVRQTTGILDSVQSDEAPKADYQPESKGEIIRKSGLAWSAGIAFFGSVMFLLILGWFAGLLLGNSTWGAVGGVILGSIIGFIQLFRITSQILKNNE